MTRSEKEKIINYLTPLLNPQGYECLDIDWNDSERTLCIFIERVDSVYVSIEDCVAVNRLLDGEQGIECFFDKEFYLEVSSPGLEPPLRTKAHFEGQIGKQINVKLGEKVADRMAGRGTLIGVSAEGEVSIETSRGLWSFPLAQIQKAHVIYTSQ